MISKTIRTELGRPFALATCFWALSVLPHSGPLPRARAHPLSPAAVLVRERSPARYEVTFRRSAQAASSLTLEFPPTCQLRRRNQTQDSDQLVEISDAVCTRPIDGQTVRVLGLVEMSLGALVYVQFADGRTVRALLGTEQQSLVLPTRSSSWSVLRDYVGLGAEHLVTGLDHLLFVAGLTLLVRRLRALVVTLTAFTVGHSVTLCLAALGWLSIPQQPVEVGIALSLVALALTLLGDRDRSRFSWWMTGLFGLLHGLGFAGALAETGLPQDAIPLALFGFNLGVEFGQLAVVGLLVPALWLFGRWGKLSRERLRPIAAYGIGCLAAMWCLERSIDWLR